MDERVKENALRLVMALEGRADDPHCVEQLAKLLNYLPDQLAKDMKDLWTFATTPDEDAALII